jgi:hypothetical protein
MLARMLASQLGAPQGGVETGVQLILKNVLETGNGGSAHTEEKRAKNGD